MIQESVHNYLISKVDLTAYVGERIYWPDAPQGSTYPLITFKTVSAPKDYMLDDEWQRWRFYIFDEDKFVVNTISDKLKGYLQNLYGDVDVDYIDLITRIDEIDPEYRADDQVYYKYIDFRVIYH
ncbi:MAG TPA: hypothetical protein VMZ04_07070 [Anaerolineae bacterium]|nr:hypothetical protein [Anaerolineae bacterium]